MKPDKRTQSKPHLATKPSDAKTPPGKPADTKATLGKPGPQTRPSSKKK